MAMKSHLGRLALILATALPLQAGLIYSTDGTATPGFSGGYGYGGPFSPVVAIQFVATTSGVLSSITAPLNLVGGNSPTLILEVLTNSAGAPATILDSLTFTVSSGGPTLFTAYSTTNPLLNAGTTYWLEAEWTLQQDILWFGTNPMLAGTDWVGGTESSAPFLPAFAIEGVSAPEPGSGVLLVAGALLFVFVRSRRSPLAS